jgi:hypothetical protein
MGWWRIARCAWTDDTRELDAYLADAWEPFAVTETDHAATVWLRRLSDSEHAGAEQPKPRFESEVARLASDRTSRDEDARLS